MYSIFLILIICLTLSACSKSKEEKIIDSFQQESSAGLTEPLKFDSFEEYDTYFSTDRSILPNCYILKSLPSGYVLSNIMVRDEIYIMVTYEGPLNNTSLNEDSMDSYSRERLSSIICKLKLYEDSGTALKDNYIDKGYSPVEYGGKVYYYLPEYSLDGQTLIGFEMAFLENDDLIYLHLPATDTLENMLAFTEVEERIIK